MLLTHMLMWGLGTGSLGHSETIIGPSVTEQDTLRFECARHLIEMPTRSNRTGALFYEPGVLFTSITANDGRPLLLLQTEAGVFVVTLEAKTLNRILVQVPFLKDAATRSTIRMGYSHDAGRRRRYFDYVFGIFMTGQNEDFREYTAVPAPYLKEHLDHLLLEYIDQVADAVFDGQITSRMQADEFAACQRLAHLNPRLARYTERRLAHIRHLIVEKIPTPRVSARMPASVFPN